MLILTQYMKSNRYFLKSETFSMRRKVPALFTLIERKIESSDGNGFSSGLGTKSAGRKSFIKMTSFVSDCRYDGWKRYLEVKICNFTFVSGISIFLSTLSWRTFRITFLSKLIRDSLAHYKFIWFQVNISLKT